MKTIPYFHSLTKSFFHSLKELNKIYAWISLISKDEPKSIQVYFFILFFRNFSLFVLFLKIDGALLINFLLLINSAPPSPQ